MSKYLIVKTTPTSGNSGGRYPVSADNILTIVSGVDLSIVYAGGVVVKITMIENIKIGDEGVASFFTSRIRTLQESANSTIEVNNIIPNVYAASGNAMKVASISSCVLATGSC
tara:strand:- start:2501 stop:2839 length:339 start_codon:yes stop_codon:yes gene_type:complete